MVADMRPFLSELRASLISFPNFVRCQCLIARNLAELFSSNRGVSHLHEACRIDELSKVKGLFWGLNSHKQLAIKMYHSC